MSQHIEQVDKSGYAWKIEITIDRSCIDCLTEAGTDDQTGGVLINRRDRMISVYNYEIISWNECGEEGNHVE